MDTITIIILLLLIVLLYYFYYIKSERYNGQPLTVPIYVSSESLKKQNEQRQTTQIYQKNQTN